MQTRHWQVIAAVSFFSLVACDKVKLKVDVDAGPLCSAQERLINGTCRFVCQRDGECESGERCNLLLGSCEPKPAAMDASVAQLPCTEGAVRCAIDGKSVEKCDRAGAWNRDAQCAPPDGFCQNERCLSCRPGASKCSGTGSVQICAADGSAYRTVACAVGSTCTTDTATSSSECRECMVGQKRCSANAQTVEECQRLPRDDLRQGYVAAGDNFDGTCITQVCEMPATGPRCKVPACIPSSTQCLNVSTQQTCSATGAWVDTNCVTALATPNAECQGGSCVDECSEAARAKSYFGCEYWAVNMDNSMDKIFKGNATSGQGTADSEYVFVVTNQSATPATVEIWRHVSGAPVKIKTVNVPGRNDAQTKGLVKIPVPWQSVSPSTTAIGEAITGLARYGYRLTSTRPVTVYQFNPIDAQKVTAKACTGTVGSSDCSCNETGRFNCTFSVLGSCISCERSGVCSQQGAVKRCAYSTFTNDASLLLPSHILGLSYVAITPGHAHYDTAMGQFPSPGIMNILATQDNTTVTVKAAGAIVSGTGIAAMALNETRSFVLNSYEVLQLASATSGTNVECVGGTTLCRKSSELSGSVVTSDKPIAMFAGASCYQVPYDRSACDHVEEQLFPFATLGKNFAALPSHPLRLNNQNFSTNPPPDHFKIVAGAAATITMTPPPLAASVLAPNTCLAGTSLQANNCQLAGGGRIEFKSVVPFKLTATNPISVAQFLPGQGDGTGLMTDPEQGDPSMILLPPVEQWRSRYTVLASTGLKDNYLGLTIDGSKVASVAVDGTTVTGFIAIGATGFLAKNHPVSTGTHTIVVTPKPNQTVIPGAGVTVYGYDSYVSYGYTGGLDLGSIVTGVTPGG
jgi:hypothetical protein